tara:strand:- start:107 stop:373 length:267 start_codon:yes stop_codon:yes gene_type:complete
MFTCDTSIQEKEDGSAVVTVNLCPRALRILKYRNGVPKEVFDLIYKQVESDANAIVQIAINAALASGTELPSTNKQEILDHELTRGEQ